MSLADLSLIDLVPALRPEWRRPFHLAQWCAAIESSILGGKRCIDSEPFQHHKSTTTMVGVVWILLRRPQTRIILLTHSHEKAQAMGKDLRDLAKTAGIQVPRGFDTITDWRTEQGGGVVVMSAQQSRLGYACDLLLVDDPLDETEYMISEVRDRVDATIAHYTARCASHLNSVLIVASRWHPDDPIGRRIARKEVDWIYIHHAGIENFTACPDDCPHWNTECAEHRPDERAFAPEVMDLAAHHAMRREWAEVDPSLRIWWAQIQNEPLPDAQGFFEGETPMAGEAPQGSPVIWGVDAAFSQGKKTDFFAAVGGVDLGIVTGVFRVIRHQRGLVQAVATLVRLRDEFAEARFVTYSSGPENGVYDAIYETCGICVEKMPARWNKAVRAQKATKAWKDRKIQVRMGQPWTGPYLAEVHAFDGSEGGVDDQVDATVSMHDAMMIGRPQEGWGESFAVGRPCM